jgi:TPP-dependent pyruvate/acetoin dehydrogenase alpha subunit
VANSQKLKFFREMLLIRKFEETILELFDQGLLQGTTHTCIGQEQIAVAAMAAIEPARDVVFSNHRCHGHYLAFTHDAYGLICEIMGKQDGTCQGVGGSQHLQRGNFYSNGIQGGVVGNATGIALAERLRRSGAVTLAFLGDGTLGEGLVYESLNIASLWHLPILYVVENNRYAQSTPIELALAGSIPDRFSAFGIPVVATESQDPEDLAATFGHAVAGVREQGRPGALIIETYRLAHHSKSDDHRDPREVAEYRSRDPILLLESTLPPEETRRIDQEVSGELATVVSRAMDCRMSGGL